jgi:hypothetical protein
VIQEYENGTSCVELGKRCRAASEAYEAASRALDVGLRRDSGPTASEWKNEYHARVELRLARAAYLANAKHFTAESAAFREAAAFVSRAMSAGFIRQGTYLPPISESGLHRAAQWDATIDADCVSCTVTDESDMGDQAFPHDRAGSRPRDGWRSLQSP